MSCPNRSRLRTTHPAPRLFGFATITATPFIQHHHESAGNLCIFAASGFRFNWVRYFSQFPFPRETTEGILLPTPAALARKSSFDLLGEVVLEINRLAEPYQSLLINVHVSFYIRDLRFLLKRLTRTAHTPPRMLSCTPSRPSSGMSLSPDSPVSAKKPWKSCTWGGTRPTSEVLGPVAADALEKNDNLIPLYVNHHELRRLQSINPAIHPTLDKLQLLPAIEVKVCNQSHTKVETTGKYVPLKVAKVREPYNKVSPFVPSPGMRKKTSVKARNEVTPTSGDRKGRQAPNVLLSSTASKTVDLEKSTVDSLEHPDDGVEEQEERHPCTSESAFGSLQLLSSSLHSEMMPGRDKLDAALHPLIKEIIEEALREYPDDIDSVFERVSQRAVILLERDLPHSSPYTDRLLVSQCIWRGIQEVCCGGSLSPRQLASQDLLGYAETEPRRHAADVSTESPDSLPALRRLERFEMAGEENDGGDEEDIRSTDATSHLNNGGESSRDFGSSPSNQRSSVISVASPTYPLSRGSRTPQPPLLETITRKEEDLLHMHTRERILRRSSTELDGDEAAGLIAFLESVRKQAVPKQQLPKAYKDWSVVIPRPAFLLPGQAQMITEHREGLRQSVKEAASGNFIFNSVKESLVKAIGDYLHKVVKEQKFGQSQEEHDLICDSQVRAAEIVGDRILNDLGLDFSTTTLGTLHEFMVTNLGVKFQARAVRDKHCQQHGLGSDRIRRFLWTSHVEQSSKFTWFTNETIISEPHRGTARQYRFLRPQLFRSPQFSSSLIARQHLAEAWSSVPCSKRKVINEQMIATLDFCVSSIETIEDNEWIPSVLREGSDEWHSLFGEYGCLSCVTDLEWELLFCDFVLEGIQAAAVTHLRELA